MARDCRSVTAKARVPSGSRWSRDHCNAAAGAAPAAAPRGPVGGARVSDRYWAGLGHDVSVSVTARGGGRVDFQGLRPSIRAHSASDRDLYSASSPQQRPGMTQSGSVRGLPPSSCGARVESAWLHCGQCCTQTGKPLCGCQPTY